MHYRPTRLSESLDFRLRTGLAGLILILVLSASQALAQPPEPGEETPSAPPTPTTSTPAPEPLPTPDATATPELEDFPELEELIEDVKEEDSSAVEPAFATPRASYENFMELMSSAGPFRPDFYILARRHVDLSELSGLVRDEQGVAVSKQLHAVLQAIEGQLEPSAFEQPRPDTEEVVLYRQSGGDLLTMVRDEEGRWYFSRRTVRAVPTLYKVLTARGKIETWRIVYLEFELFGLTGYQWLTLLLLPLFSYAVGRLFLRIARGALMRFVPGELGQDMVRRRKAVRPLGWLVASIVFWAGISAFTFPAWLLVLLTTAVKIVVTVSLIQSLFRASDAASSYLSNLTSQTSTKFDDMLIPLARRTFKTLVAVLALLFLAQNLEIEVWSLFAGFSIFGAMIALAGQDIMKNLFGSVTVLTDRPFAVGDWVNIEGIEGIVEDVGFRSTRIRTFYNSLVTLPNSRLITANVDNYGERTYRRYVARFSVPWETSPDRLEAFCEGVRELIRTHPQTRKDSYQVWVNDINPHALEILMWVFFLVPDWTSELRERHRLLIDIHRLANELDVQFAYPAQQLYVSQERPQPEPPTFDVERIEGSRAQGREVTGRLLEASLPKGSPPP